MIVYFKEMKFLTDNPFRILGVSIITSEREIQKKITRVKRFTEVGKAVKFETDFSFLSNFTRTLENLSLASNTIEHPKKKLIHSLYWFWYNNHIDSVAFDNLSNDNIEKSIDIWSKVVKDGNVSSKNFSCLVNLKSLYLCLSLQNNTFDKKLFKNAMTLAGKFMNHDELNSYILKVAGNNIKITNQDLEIEYFKNLLPFAKPFLDITSGISTIEFISSFDTFSKKTKIFITKEFSGESIKKIEDLISTTSELRKKSVSKALLLGNTLYQNIKPQLESVHKILGKENIEYQMLANKIANELLQCGIEYFNFLTKNKKDLKKDGNKILKLCDLAKEIVSGFQSQINDRIDENYKIMNQWLDDSLNEIISAYEKALKVFKNFKNQDHYGYEERLFEEASKLDDILSKSSEITLVSNIHKNKDKEKENISLCDAVVQLAMALIISAYNEKLIEYKSSYASVKVKIAERCEKLLKLFKIYKMSVDTRNKLYDNLSIIEKNKQVAGQNEGGCYIATMVYGNYDHPQVLVLRNFRDKFLVNYLFGKSLIKFYYRYSPLWVKFLKNRRIINKLIKFILNIFIKIIKK